MNTSAGEKRELFLSAIEYFVAMKIKDTRILFTNSGPSKGIQR